MSQKTVQSWLLKHHEFVPALEVFHRQALENLNDHSKTVGDLANIIVLDPGMSVSLYHEVNSRLNHKTRAESIPAALNLMGDSAIADLILQHKVLNETHTEAQTRQAYHQLMSRAMHLLAQLKYFASLQGISVVDEIRSAALLHNVGEFCACLFDHEHYREYQQKFTAMGSDANSAKPVFGFDFHELGRQYAEKSFLPKLVTESLNENIPAGRMARLIQLAADVSHQAEVGWYHSSMKATEAVCAAYLNQSPEGFNKHLQTVAIEAARSSPFDDVLPAASRLITLPDRETQASPVTATTRTPEGPEYAFGNRLSAMLKSAHPNHAQLLDLLLGYLHDDLHLTQVVLMLLTADKGKLRTRAGRGIDGHSPIRNLTIDISKTSLLKSLLDKPRALWIESEDYHRYEAVLPAKFKTSFLHESFFLMPLLIADEPIGLIYCDRAQAPTRLDKLSYTKFESAIMLTREALHCRAKRKR